MRRVTTYCFVVAVVVTAALVTTGCQDVPAPVRRPTAVTVAAVLAPHASTCGRYSGTIVPETTVDVSFKVGGYVTEILAVTDPNGRPRKVQPGDRVASGTTLARVRDREFALEVGQMRAGVDETDSGLAAARAQMRGAEALAEQAARDFARAERLLAANSITRAEHDGLRARRDSTRAACDAAAAQIRSLQAKATGVRRHQERAEVFWQDTRVQAPIDGVVLEKRIEPGGLVGPGTVAFVLGDDATVRLTFSVPDRILPQVASGRELTARAESLPDRTLRGTVRRIAPVADPLSRNFEIELTVANPDRSLRPGMIATVEVEEPPIATGTGLIPITTVVRSGVATAPYAVLIATEESGALRARRRLIDLGEPLGNLVTVTTGLGVGERVIDAGAPLLTEGEAVRIITDAPGEVR